MVEGETMAFLAQLLGSGARFVPAEDVMAEMREVTPEMRAQKVLNMLLLAPLGDRQVENILARIRFVSHDVTPLGQRPFDWMLTRDEARRLEPNVDDLLGLTSVLLPSLTFKGYVDWDGIRSRLGGAVTPATMAMMEVWGPRGLRVSFRNDGGRISNEELTLPMSKMIGEVAYTQAGIRAFNARDTDQYGGVMMAILGKAVAKALGRSELMSSDLVIQAEEQAKVIGADVLTQNGEPIKSWDHLMQLLSGMPFIGEGFVNTMSDQLEMAQHVYGGFANESARATWGSLYFIDEGTLNHQLGPEVHFLSVFGGLLSQYADKGGLEWMFHDEGWVDVFNGSSLTGEKNHQTENQRLRSEFIREVTTFEPRQGAADLLESRMLQCFIESKRFRGMPVKPESIQGVLETVPKLGRRHLRPPELWVSRARMLLRNNADYQRAWNAPDADLSAWAAKLEMSLSQTMGVMGVLTFLEEAAKRGVGIYEWNNFNARMVGDELRYANKVANSSEPFRVAGNLTCQSGANLSADVYEKTERSVILNSINAVNLTSMEMAVDEIKKSEKDLLKWMPLASQESFTAAFVRGVIRANLVPFFKDESTLMFDFDENEFISSEAVSVKPKKMWRHEIEEEMRSQGRSIDELDLLMAESGCRWSTYRNGKKFIVNSSGRPAYRAATALELYNKANQVLSELESHLEHLDNDALARIERLRNVYNAIRTNGWNRFSVNWWMGYTPASPDGLKLLVELLKDAELVGDGDALRLKGQIERLSQPGDERLLPVGRPKILYRPLGSIRDPALGLPDPCHMKPDQVKFTYQAFSAHNR